MFQFTIHGIPHAQKQTRFVMIAGKPRCYDPSKKEKEHIQWQVKPFAPETPLAGPVELTICFFMPIPKGTSKKTHEAMVNRVILPCKKPDEDNLAYIVTNALKQIVYQDDNQIVAKHVYKFYGNEPKTVIRVRSISQITPVGYRDVDDLV